MSLLRLLRPFAIASPGDSLVTEVTSALGTPPKFPRSLGFTKVCVSAPCQGCCKAAVTCGYEREAAPPPRESHTRNKHAAQALHYGVHLVV